MPTVFLAYFLLAQVVFVGKPDKSFCDNERVRPNLTLAQTTAVRGRITDIAGAPLKKSRVELRNYVSDKKQTFVKGAETDTDGRFDLGNIDRGEYRLLASPTRAFRQPDPLSCADAADVCELTIRLKIKATDQPESICPIR